MSLQIDKQIQNQDVQNAYFINASLKDSRKKLDALVQERRVQPVITDDFGQPFGFSSMRSKLSNSMRIGSRSKNQLEYTDKHMLQQQYGNCQNLNQLENIARVQADLYNDPAILERIATTNRQNILIQDKLEELQNTKGHLQKTRSAICLS